MLEFTSDLLLDRTFEQPKSVNLQVPFLVSKMFFGLISLCSSFLSWQYLMAKAI